jgi:hypothetical protein
MDWPDVPPRRQLHALNVFLFLPIEVVLKQYFCAAMSLLSAGSGAGPPYPHPRPPGGGPAIQVGPAYPPTSYNM